MKKGSGRQLPVKIPLSFGAAIGGLLAVDPKKMPPKPVAKKKSAKAPRRGKK